MATSTAHAPTFEDFWPLYVRAHTSRANRTLHVIGTSLALACLLAAVVKRRPWLALLAPVAGYGFGWCGHLVEHSRPMNFTHPIYSVRANVLMWWKTLAGDMDAEVQRILAADRAASQHSSPAVAEQPVSDLN